MVRVQLHHPVITAINLKDRYKIIRRVQNDYVLNPPFFILTSFNYAKIPAEYPRIPNINNPRIIQSGDTCFRISQTQINVSTTGARTSMLEFANWPIRWPPDIWLNQPEIETKSTSTHLATITPIMKTPNIEVASPTFLIMPVLNRLIILAPWW